jgi:glycosyltransferase involved in cell wall biosynthesis
MPPAPPDQNHQPDQKASPGQTGKFQRGVSMLAWGYNEEILVEGFLDRAFALLEAHVADYELVFVDDGSTDRTPEILKAYAERQPRLRVLTNNPNRNVGYSCSRAISEARKEFLFWQTVDWSYDLKNLPIFLSLLEHFDVVQGIRPTPIRLLSYIPVIRSIYRVRTRSDNLRKAIVSLANYYLLRILYGVRFHDFQNVTFYPSALLQQKALRGDSSFINPECLFTAYKSGACFIEVPIGFIPRVAGVAKGTKWSSIRRSLRDIFFNWLDWGWRFRMDVARDRTRRIFRVAEPFFLNDDVLRLVTPLFKDYR